MGFAQDAASVANGGKQGRQESGEVPTGKLRQMPPRAPSFASHRPRTGLEAAAEALVADEMGRLRIMTRVLMAALAAATFAAPLLGGDVFARRVMIFALVCSLGALAQVHRLASSARSFDVDRVGALALVLGVCHGAAVNFVGVFSPAPTIGALGLYMFCLGSSAGWSAAMLAVLGGSHLMLALPILLGIRADPGLVTAGSLGVGGQITLTICVLIIYAMAFASGRAGRALLTATITHLERAVRDITERDAQLHEAKRELERAAWLGGEGRFSHQQVGSFRLGNVVGRGGMGEVYEAEHVRTGQDAAVKLLGRSGFADPHVRMRFAREARAAATLRSEHVVRVLEAPEEGAAIPYLAMERLRGEDLSSMLRREKRLSPEDTLKLVREVGRGLDAAQRAGIVHRDLKPQNLFLARTEPRPIWKVLDFGVSKIEGLGSLSHDQLVGTPEYMAPEQARGDAVDYRADLYALAAVAYRCLTGTPPYVGRDVASLVYQVVHDKPAAPSGSGKVGAQLEAVLGIGLARSPARRFVSGEALATAFEQAIAGTLSPQLLAHAEQIIEAEPWRT